MRNTCVVLFCTVLFVAKPGFASGKSPDASPAVTYPEVTHLIRANDLLKLKQVIRSPQDANAPDKLQNTPLHYAAMFGSAESVDLLLSSGAAVDAHNSSGTTPLQLAAWEFRRTRALVEHGANVNANRGITPLLLACSMRGNSDTVRYLVAKGADVKAIGPGDTDPLMTCAATGETDTVAFLLGKGADVHHTDKAGFTALQNATAFGDTERIRLLLSAGSDPNSKNAFGGMVKNGPIALVHLTPLMTLAPFGTPDAVQLLLKAGARVNDVDIRKMSALMLSIATDQANPDIVDLLIRAGADVNAKDQNGESVLDWAHKFENPRILALLKAAGATGHDADPRPVPPSGGGNPQVTEAMARATPLIQNVGTAFFREGGGCAGCHHQPAFARIPGVGRQGFLDSMLAFRPRLIPAAAGLGGLGGDADPPLAYLAAYADLGEPANDTTDMLVHYIAARQSPSGAWVSLGIARPPIEDSTISRTALGIRALTTYSFPARQPEFTDRVTRARKWLSQATPKTTYEAAERLTGLQLAGASAPELRADADQLIALQRADGGWAQTPFLPSDAYATGLVLDTLFRVGVSSPKDPVYVRGTQFLLQTQFPDGSWYVRSRAPKFQPYFQTGFPFVHDQWISSDGTAWALAALSHATKDTSLAER